MRGRLGNFYALLPHSGAALVPSNRMGKNNGSWKLAFTYFNGFHIQPCAMDKDSCQERSGNTLHFFLLVNKPNLLLSKKHPSSLYKLPQSEVSCEQKSRQKTTNINRTPQIKLNLRPTHCKLPKYVRIYLGYIELN